MNDELYEKLFGPESPDDDSDIPDERERLLDFFDDTPSATDFRNSFQVAHDDFIKRTHAKLKRNATLKNQSDQFHMTLEIAIEDTAQRLNVSESEVRAVVSFMFMWLRSEMLNEDQIELYIKDFCTFIRKRSFKNASVSVVFFQKIIRFLTRHQLAMSRAFNKHLDHKTLHSLVDENIITEENYQKTFVSKLDRKSALRILAVIRTWVPEKREKAALCLYHKTIYRGGSNWRAFATCLLIYITRDVGIAIRYDYSVKRTRELAEYYKLKHDLLKYLEYHLIIKPRINNKQNKQ